MLYDRLRDLEGPEEIDELAKRLADNVAELESRLELIIADTLSE